MQEAVKDLDEQVKEHAVELRQFHLDFKVRYEKLATDLNQKTQSAQQHLVELLKRFNHHDHHEHHGNQLEEVYEMNPEFFNTDSIACASSEFIDRVVVETLAFLDLPD